MANHMAVLHGMAHLELLPVTQGLKLASTAVPGTEAMADRALVRRLKEGAGCGGSWVLTHSCHSACRLRTMRADSMAGTSRIRYPPVHSVCQTQLLCQCLTAVGTRQGEAADGPWRCW